MKENEGIRGVGEIDGSEYDLTRHELNGSRDQRMRGLCIDIPLQSSPSER